MMVLKLDPLGQESRRTDQEIWKIEQSTHISLSFSGHMILLLCIRMGWDNKNTEHKNCNIIS